MFTLAWLAANASTIWGIAGRYRSVESGGKALMSARKSRVTPFPEMFCRTFNSAILNYNEGGSILKERWFPKFDSASRWTATH